MMSGLSGVFGEKSAERGTRQVLLFSSPLVLSRKDQG